MMVREGVSLRQAPNDFWRFLRAPTLRSFTSVLLVLAASNLAQADNTSTPTLTHEAFITADDAMITPSSVAQASDGGLIIAGKAGVSAWAAKTDSHGKILWNYYALADSDAPGAPAPPQGFFPEFRGAVPMPDGSTFLCGFRPTSPGTYAPGLLSHVDQQGHKLEEQLVVPHNRPQRGIARFDTCTRFGNGLLLQGDIVDWSPEPNGHFSQNNLYWFIRLNEGGEVVWEKQIPMRFGFAVADFGQLIITPDSSFLFSTINNTHDVTDIMRVNDAGEIRSTIELRGAFLLVHPVIPDGTIQVIGQISADGPDRQTALTFDDNLNETQRVQGANPNSLLARLAYRLPDQSLVLFGSKQHSWVGPSLTAAIVHLNPTLHSEGYLDLTRHGDFLWDTGSIWAAAPIGTAGEFVAIRSVFLNNQTRAGNNATNLPANFQRGAAVDFAHVE